MSCLDERLLCLCFPAAREQLAATRGRTARLHEANTILTEQVMEAEHDCDDAVVDSSTTVVKAGQYRDLHAAFLEECRGVINVLLSARVSVEDHLSNVLRRFREVIHHVVHHGAELALAAASL